MASLVEAFGRLMLMQIAQQLRDTICFGPFTWNVHAILLVQKRQPYLAEGHHLTMT